MKILYLVALILAASLNGGTATVKIGEEADFVATAVRDLGTTAPVLSSATGGVGNRGIRILHGYFMRKIDPGSWPSSVPLLQRYLRLALVGEGWKTENGEELPMKDSYPRSFFWEAHRGDESIEVFVIEFPPEDGAVKLAYEQRRSFTERNQSAQPSPGG